MSTKPKSNNIIFRIIKFLYENFIVILPLLVGLNLLIQYLSTNELTVYLYESEEKGANYSSNFEIYNEGSPISKYELIQPLTINLEDDNAIIDFDLILKEPEAIKVWFSKLKKNKLKVDFDLLNESENIRFSILTKRPIQEFTVSSRIKNIENVVTYHHKVKPKVYDRIGKFWIFLLLFSTVTFIDAMLLVGKDKQLKAILTCINGLTIDSNKERFLAAYESLYESYNVRFKRNKETIIVEIAQLFDTIQDDTITNVQLKMKSVTKKSVLYNLRKPYLLISPVLFLIGLVVIIASIIFYAVM